MLNAKFAASRDKTGFALADRDHYVTAIVYLKPPPAGADHKPYRVYVNYEARNAKTGEPIRQDDQAFYAAVQPVLERLRLLPGDVAQNCSDRDLDQLLYQFSDRISRFGVKQAFGLLSGCLTKEGQDKIQESAYYLASSVLAVRDLVPPTSFLFYVKPGIFPAQLTFLGEVAPQIQSSKKVLTVAIPFEGKLEIDNVRARLIPSAANLGSFSPRTMTIARSGGSSRLVLEFPAIAALKFGGLPKAQEAALQTPAGWLVCAATSDLDLQRCTTAVGQSGGGTRNIYARMLNTGYSEAPASEPPIFTLAAAADSVQIGSDGVASFAVMVEPAKGAPVTLTARGGELLVGGNPVSELNVAAKGVQPITLRNATPGSVVVLTGVSKAAADPTVKYETSVTIAVRAAAASKQ